MKQNTKKTKREIKQNKQPAVVQLHPLYRAEQIRAHEVEAAHQAGLTAWQLMERAGQALLRCLEKHSAAPAAISVFCGAGNNGGDGYVIATLAHRAGYRVRVFAPEEPSENQSLEAALALNLWLDTEQGIEPFDAYIVDTEYEEALVIDALLGTGLNRPVEAPYADLIEQINARTKQRQIPVIAVDVPSGLHANTGQVLGQAIQASYTVSFVGMKLGLYTGEAKAHVGQLYFASLGMTESFQRLTQPNAWRLEGQHLEHWLPARSALSHKGDSGHVLLIGGARGMTGALRLAAEAALRVGAGKVSVICEAGFEFFFADLPEVLCYGIDIQNKSDLALFDQCLAQATHLGIGPGLGQGEWGQTLWEKVQAAEQPKVVDADALNLLAQKSASFEKNVQNNWILTPHPGEAARLLNCTLDEIEADRWAAAAAIQQKYGGVVVLKGAGSLIQASGKVAVCTAGSPVLACAGTGDVLTGAVAGIWAQNVTLDNSSWEVGCAAVLAHALAGERAAEQFVTKSAKCLTRGLIASDFMPHLVYWANPK